MQEPVSHTQSFPAVHGYSAEAAGLPSKLEQYMLDKDGGLLLERARGRPVYYNS